MEPAAAAGLPAGRRCYAGRAAGACRRRQQHERRQQTAAAAQRGQASLLVAGTGMDLRAVPAGARHQLLQTGWRWSEAAVVELHEQCRLSPASLPPFPRVLLPCCSGSLMAPTPPAPAASTPASCSQVGAAGSASQWHCLLFDLPCEQLA